MNDQGERRRVILAVLLQCSHKEHFAEHIEAVVTGRPVGADGEVDAVIVKTLQRADAGRELQVGGWIGDGRQFPVTEDLKIAVLHPDAVVAAASVLEHA